MFGERHPLVTTNRSLELIKCMTRLVMFRDIGMAFRAEIIVGTSRAFIPNSRDVGITSIANDVRMQLRIEIPATTITAVDSERGVANRTGVPYSGNSLTPGERRSIIRRNVLLHFNLNVRKRNSKFDHGMSCDMSAGLTVATTNILFPFAALAEIKIWTDGAFISDAADATSRVLASWPIATDVDVFHVQGRESDVYCRRERFVQGGK